MSFLEFLRLSRGFCVQGTVSNFSVAAVLAASPTVIVSRNPATEISSNSIYTTIANGYDVLIPSTSRTGKAFT